MIPSFRRFTIVADVQTPSGPLLCYCAHLEVFTGIVGRISALSDILADAELYSEKYPYQIIFGDLNTISHSIARLAKAISTDQYRVMSVGSHEAEWWDQNLWSWHVQDGEFNLALATGGWSWLRRIGVLGLGTGKLSSTDPTFGAADTRYSSWLKKLVEAGLDKVKQARLDQIASDIFVNLESQQHRRPIGRLNKSALSALESSLTQSEGKDQETSVVATTGSSMGGRASTLSENSFQETVEGSMILVDRSRSPSIVTLDSSLLDRSDYSYIRSANSTSTSSPTWSLPSTSSLLQYEHPGMESDGENGEDQAADGREHANQSGEGEDRHLGPNEHYQNRVASGGESDPYRHRRNPQDISPRAASSFPSTPLTPSPTLRLIPPTPKRRRSRVLGCQGGKTDSSHSGIEEEHEGDEEEGEDEGDQEEGTRGIVLQYDDEENGQLHGEKQGQLILEDGDDNALFREGGRLQQQQRNYTHQHTQINDDTTLRTCNDHHDDIHYHHDLMTTTSTNTATTTSREPIDAHQDTFQEPQPPFLLSHFETRADLKMPLQEAASLEFFASRRLWSGFTPLVLHQARHPGFYDPWDSGKDLTLHNPAFLGLLSAKLDYTLLRNLRCERRAMGNHDYSASDHKWLLVEVVFEREFVTTGAATIKTESENDEGETEKRKQREKKEWTLPSKEQQYLWWRERRQQWGQPVQPLCLDRFQQQGNTRGKGNGQHKKRRSSSSSSSSSTASIVMATLTAVAAVGGYLWWTRRGR